MQDYLIHQMTQLLSRMHAEFGVQTQRWGDLHTALSDLHAEVLDLRRKQAEAQMERTENRDFVHFALDAERTRIMFAIKDLFQEHGELPSLVEVQNIVWDKGK